MLVRKGCLMKTIMIDMDDVITCDNFIKIVSDYLGYEVKYDDIKTYYIQDVLGEKKKEFFEKFKDMNLYEKAELEPGCYEVIKALSEKYEVYICTDYLWREIIEFSGNTLKNKYEFLYKIFDFLNPRNFIFTGDKSIINCDIKIDDKIDNLKGAKLKLLYTAYHNKCYDEEMLKEEKICRINNWDEIKNILL